jgi:hypothetical protein
MRIVRNVASTLAVAGSGYLLLIAWGVAVNLRDRAKGGNFYVSALLATPREVNYVGRVMIAFACALVAAFLVLAVGLSLSDAGIL